MIRLSDVLFTVAQQKLLGLLYGQPEKSFYLRQILRITDMGVATIRRELQRMHQAGITGKICEALLPLADDISWAFIFGSVASGKKSASSDVDLMIVGDVQFSEVANVLFPVQESLGGEVNPKIFSQEEWTCLRTKGDVFVREIMSKPYMDVMGDRDGVGESGRSHSGKGSRR